MKILWAHGLESSAEGSKPTWMIENLGWDVVSPAVIMNGWTITEQTVVVVRALEENDVPVVIMGS